MSSQPTTPRQTDEERRKKEQKNIRWIAVQRQAFTHWANETVQKRGMSCTDVSVDFKTGILLINFFELLSGKIIREKYIHNPKTKIHYVENLHIALKFMEKEMRVRNPGCSVEDIIDAEEKGDKLVLGLLWVLFRMFRLNPVDLLGDQKGKKMKEEDAMLAWIRQTTEGYDGVNITTFKQSFNDGKAFLALCHAYTAMTGEKGFDYNEMKDKSVDEILEFAFNFAQDNMGITKLLEVEEVKTGDLDERALVIYASLFHHAFKTFKDLQEMKNELGSASSALQFQMKNKNDLIQMNLDMTKQIEEMKQKKNLMIEELGSLNQQIEEMKQKNSEKEQQLKEYDLKTEEYKKKIEEYNEQTQKYKKENEELEGKIKELEIQNAETDKTKSELQQTLDALKKELDELDKEIEVQKDLQNGADITSKFEAQTKKNKQLEEEVCELEEQFEEYEEASRNLRKNLEDLEIEKRMYQDDLNEIDKNAEMYCGALGILKKQIDLHNDDLQRWSNMLEGKSDVGDVDSILLKLQQDNEEKSTEERINALISLLQKENEDMDKLYNSKLNEGNPGAAGEKKKPAVKKPMVKKK